MDGWRDVLYLPTHTARRGLTRATAIFFFFGGVIELTVTGLMPPSEGRTDALVVIGVGAMLAGPLMWMLEPYFTVWLVHLSVLAGTGLITVATIVAGGGPLSVGVSCIFIFTVLDSGFFFTRTGVVLQVVVMAACTVLSLGLVHVEAGTIVAVTGCAVVGGLVVAWLLHEAYGVPEDNLTGLPSGRGADLEIAGAIASATRSGRPLAVVLLGLDRFRRVNEEHGTTAGDRVLRDAARAWRSGVGSGNVLCRIGGDRFVAVLPGAALGDASDLADELRGLTPLPLTSAAGVAAWTPGDSASVLLGRADTALYEAKHGGGNRTVVFGGSSRAARELEDAVAAGEMTLYYQPVVRLADREQVSVEALVRWNHPTRGQISPGYFVPLAEQTGAIHVLGQWTLREAATQADSPELRALASVAVNLSVHELRNPDFVANVRRIVAEVGVDPARLTFEVTEGVFDDDNDQMVEALAQLRATGARVAIDDFGSGYSSLRWLKRLPADILKIDASFVWAIEDDADSDPLLEGIINLGKAMGKVCVAEGIETEHQARVLTDLGCDLGQGYLFGRPSPLVVDEAPRETVA